MSEPSGTSGRGQFWVLTLVAGLAFALVAVNLVLARKSLSLQSEINDRQQFINQTIRISRLNTQVIQALANLSAKTGDAQIKALLAANGISFSENVALTAEPESVDEQNPEEPE